MEITKDVYKIKGEGNVYLILKPEPIVIDTGCVEEIEKIKKEIEKIISLEKIKKVILTHLHHDHSDNVSLFPNAEFYVDEEELEDFLENPNNFFFGKIPEESKEILEKKLKPLPEEINGLKVLKVPGHTRGSIAIVDEERKLLFSGDTLFGDRIGRTDFENSIPEKMDESVERLVKISIDEEYTLCPGHDY